MQSCPKCKSDLRGEPMDPKHFVHDRTSEEHQRSVETHKKYNLTGECTCLPYGDKAPEDRFYSRLIGMEVRGVYDGVLIWYCPDCGHKWPRFADGKRHDAAVKIIAESDVPRETTAGVA